MFVRFLIELYFLCKIQMQPLCVKTYRGDIDIWFDCIRKWGKSYWPCDSCGKNHNYLVCDNYTIRVQSTKYTLQTICLYRCAYCLEVLQTVARDKYSIILGIIWYLMNECDVDCMRRVMGLYITLFMVN